MAQCPYQGKRKANGMLPCRSPERLCFDHQAGAERSSPCLGDTVELCAAYQRAEKHKAWTEVDGLRARVKTLARAGEGVAKALEVMCRRLGEKNPRKTVPVLAAWDAAKKGGE